MALQRFFKISLLVLAVDCAISYEPFIERCDLIQKLNDAEVVGMKGCTLGDCVCLVHYTSGYDSSLHVSQSEYGLFQINSVYWCDDGKTLGRKNLCGIPCSKLLDKNITDDIQCFARILKDPKGMDAWYAWPPNCKGKDLSEFTNGC